MGEVYRAKDTRLDRPVAIKVLPSDLAADPASEHRMDREARAISRFNIRISAPFMTLARQAGPTFLVMEILKARPLPTG